MDFLTVHKNGLHSIMEKTNAGKKPKKVIYIFSCLINTIQVFFATCTWTRTVSRILCLVINTFHASWLRLYCTRCTVLQMYVKESELTNPWQRPIILRYARFRSAGRGNQDFENRLREAVPSCRRDGIDRLRGDKMSLIYFWTKGTCLWNAIFSWFTTSESSMRIIPTAGDAQRRGDDLKG